jgi:hypothetical protein
MLRNTSRVAPSESASCGIAAGIAPTAPRGDAVIVALIRLRAAHAAKTNAGPCSASSAVASAEPPSVLTLSQELIHTFAMVSSPAERTMVGKKTADAGTRNVNAPTVAAQQPTTTATGASAKAKIAAEPSASVCTE